VAFQVGGVCYPTQKAAALAWASSWSSPSTQLSEGCMGVLRLTAGGDDTAPAITYSWDVVAGACAAPASSVVAYTATPCQLVDYPDALVMGWGVALCWAVAWGVARFLRGAV